MCDMGQLISKHFKCIKWIPERETTRLLTAAIFQHGGLAEGEARGGLQSRRPGRGGRGGKGTTQLKFLTVGSLKLLPVCVACLPPSPATLYTLNSSLTLILEDELSQPHLTA